jgi:hypothetical protein
MANPNLLNLTSVLGESFITNLSTATVDLVSNAASSNKLYRINSIIVANIDTVNAATVDVTFTRAGGIRYIARDVNVPAQSTLILLAKDSAVYLMENDKISGSASASSDLTIIISYDVME